MYIEMNEPPLVMTEDGLKPIVVTKIDYNRDRNRVYIKEFKFLENADETGTTTKK